MITIDTYGSAVGGIRLKQSITRKHQFYDFRRYNEYKWVLNKPVPLLIYASSWYDKKYNIERFCGTNDLSKDEKETKELLDNSSHYYIISYKVSE